MRHAARIYLADACSAPSPLLSPPVPVPLPFIMPSSHPQLSEVDDILKSFDLDGDGEIDLEEFTAAITDHSIRGTSAMEKK